MLSSFSDHFLPFLLWADVFMLLHDDYGLDWQGKNLWPFLQLIFNKRKPQYWTYPSSQSKFEKFDNLSEIVNSDNYHNRKKNVDEYMKTQHEPDIDLPIQSYQKVPLLTLLNFFHRPNLIGAMKQPSIFLLLNFCKIFLICRFFKRCTVRKFNANVPAFLITITPGMSLRATCYSLIK